MADSFVFVDQVPLPITEETYADQMAVEWESRCYEKDPHLGLWDEAVFIVGALIIGAAGKVTRCAKTAIGS